MSASCDISSFLDGTAEALELGQAAAVKGLGEFAWMVIGDGQVICPKETGTLAASGTVGEVVLSGAAFWVEAGFNTDYAAAVHERLEAKHEAPTQAKYLEVPLNRRAPQMESFIGQRIREAL